MSLAKFWSSILSKIIWDCIILGHSIPTLCRTTPLIWPSNCSSSLLVKLVTSLDFVSYLTNYILVSLKLSVVCRHGVSTFVKLLLISRIS